MIEEHDLQRLLTAAAESIPPPGRAPEALLAALTEQAAVPARRRAPRLKVAAVAAAVVAVVALGATLTRDSTSTSKPTGTATADAPSAADVDDELLSSGGEQGEVERKLEPLDEDGLDSGVQPTASGSGSEAHNPVRPSQTTSLADSAKIIRTGSLDLEVREGAFQGTVDRITAQATGLGGYIAESTTSESADSPSGSIIVRVPGDSFETLLADVRKLGEVKGVTSKGTDVTAQFTDLEARLTALRATRDRLSTVLSEASNVPDILAVQDRITAVQIEIETAQGQQKLLEDQTSFATLAITLGEPGATIIEPESEPDEGLGKAWDDARRRFGDSIEAIVSWSGSAAVVLLVGLFLLAVSRVAWVGLRRRMV